MLNLRKGLSLLLMMVLLAQPVFAAESSEAVTAPTQPPEPDIISAVHSMQTIPGNWSPLSPATAERRWLQKMTTALPYELKDGSWQPVLARELPQDVTADYAGTYGIPADAPSGYAYRILLSSEARWEDGLMITADDYIFSIRKLLEDEENRENWTFLAGAEAALSGEKQPGQEIIPLRDAGLSDIDGALKAGFSDLYIDTAGFWGLEGGWLPITDRSRLQDFAMPSGMDERFVSPAYLYSRYLADGTEMARFQSQFIGIPKTYGNAMTMEDLGLLAASPFELVLILEEPLSPSALMLKLENLFLFRESFWGKDFATSAESYCGYGPYRITSADAQQIILQPNENWWGEPVSGEFDRIICRAGG